MDAVVTVVVVVELVLQDLLDVVDLKEFEDDDWRSFLLERW